MGGNFLDIAPNKTRKHSATTASYAIHSESNIEKHTVMIYKNQDGVFYFLIFGWYGMSCPFSAAEQTRWQQYVVLTLLGAP